jgi:hypothetical protein
MYLKKIYITMILMLGLILTTSIIIPSEKNLDRTTILTATGPKIEQLSFDEIDQHNGDYSGYGCSTYSKIAQSFTPLRNTLSKILIPLWKNGTPGDLFVSIKANLDGLDLTRITVRESQIGTDYKWYTFDFNDILFDVGETYYIVWTPTDIDENNNYFWGYGINDPYLPGSAWNYTNSYWTYHPGWPEQGHTNIDFCFSQYGYDVTFNPDLYCTGSLNWNNVKAGNIVTANFTVQNIGDPDSLLNWKIESTPEWGTWTFSPTGSKNLTPESESIIVEVFVTVPDEKEASFTGEVLVINEDDSNDFASIPVSLTTARNKIPSNLMVRFFVTFHHIPLIKTIFC